MPRVYQFKVWDMRAGTFRVSRKMSTVEGIERMHAHDYRGNWSRG